MSEAEILPEFINQPNRYRSLGWLGWWESLRELYAYREVCWWLTKREVVSRYRQSLLGVGWAVLTPLATVGVFMFLKGAKLIEVGETGAPYPLFIYAGLLPWQLFHASLMRTTHALSGQPSMVGRLRFPREVLVISGLGSALFDFLVGSLILACLFLWVAIVPAWTTLLVPLLVGAILLFALGLGLALSVLNAATRDLGRIVPLGAMLWMVLTPVFYPPATENPGAWLNWLNPLSPLVASIRDLLLNGSLTLPLELACAVTVGALFLAAGWRLFQVMVPRIAELV